MLCSINADLLKRRPPQGQVVGQQQLRSAIRAIGSPDNPIPDPPNYDSQNMHYFCYIYIGEVLSSARGSRRKRELDQVRLLGIAF